MSIVWHSLSVPISVVWRFKRQIPPVFHLVEFSVFWHDKTVMALWGWIEEQNEWRKNGKKRANNWTCFMERNKINGWRDLNGTVAPEIFIGNLRDRYTALNTLLAC